MEIDYAVEFAYKDKLPDIFAEGVSLHLRKGNEISFVPNNITSNVLKCINTRNKLGVETVDIAN